MMGQLNLKIQNSILQALNAENNIADVEIIDFSRTQFGYHVEGYYTVKTWVGGEIDSGKFDIDFDSNLDIIKFKRLDVE